MKKLFFETIQILDNIPQNISCHQDRLDKTILDNFFIQTNIKLADILTTTHNFSPIRCKIIYSDKIHHIHYYKYKQKKINSIKIIDSDIEYDYKYLDRDKIDRLCSYKKSADEIIIIKDGYITDTSIANIAIYQDNYWITPKRPLLYGTTRARLLKEGVLKEADIDIQSLKNAPKIALMNAMIGFCVINKSDLSYI